MRLSLRSFDCPFDKLRARLRASLGKRLVACVARDMWFMGGGLWEVGATKIPPAYGLPPY
jgi:hypothetical protein